MTKQTHMRLVTAVALLASGSGDDDQDGFGWR
jgi:hypothetical protein